jgi:hypothetical protein
MFRSPADNVSAEGFGRVFQDDSGIATTRNKMAELELQELGLKMQLTESN